MKLAKRSIRWWRLAIWLLAILAVGGLVWPSRTRTSYGAVCARCLQRMHGLEVTRGGFSISNEQTLERFHPEPHGGGGFTLGTMPAVDPKDYEDITGHPCDHNFKRTGYCRYRTRGVACGQFGEGMAFRPRLEPLETIYRAFGRIPDRDLGKASLRVLDRTFPPDATVQEAHKPSDDFAGTVKNLETMTLLLSIVETPDEWRTALEHFENGFQGEAPLICDRMFIEARSHSVDPLVRRGCAAVAFHHRDASSPELLEAMLDDPDEEVSARTGDTIYYGRHFELFGKLFRKHAPDDYRREQMQKYEDSEFVRLFQLNDPLVDDLCFAAIAADQRLRLLDLLVERLNHRDTEKGKAAVQQLIRGRNPLTRDPFKDPWDQIEDSKASLSQLKQQASAGMSTNGNLSSWTPAVALKALANTHDPGLWETAHDAYEHGAGLNYNEFHCAIAAKTMMELDSGRTERFLINELKSPNGHRVRAAFAGMGLIASAGFVESIEDFKKSPKAGSPGNKYPRNTNFNDGQWGQIYDYALNRCQGVQYWQLLRDKDGKYFISRP